MITLECLVIQDGYTILLYENGCASISTPAKTSDIRALMKRLLRRY
jgi:hypothetical protein